MGPIDRARTLDDLDPPAWEEPPHPSHLVATCHRLRSKPIGALSNGDLRILIGQKIGLLWLVPLALEVLQVEPLAEGDLYPGDLLVSVLRVPSDFWLRECHWRDRLRVIVESMPDVPGEVADEVAEFLGDGENTI